jgi:formylglycine-generating enzyme required for sulfatase activity
MTPPKFLTNTIGMKYVLIPAGSFTMGSPPEEAGRDDDEKLHEVTISKPFYLQTTEVTQGQWKRVMRANPSRFKECGDDCPVENVSWDDAQKFIKRLNEMEGNNKFKYRLPTEAEWEYACRARNNTPFSFKGDASKLNEYGWYSSNSERQTHPVKTLKPNLLGLYDMHGNVWEWCQDRYGDYPSSPITDPKGPAASLGRVFRGGGWYGDAQDCRVADRYYFPPVFRNLALGFRLARSVALGS